MAKDNIPFHTVLFPSILLATGDNWTMLDTINSCEYLNYEKDDEGNPGKFSKSRGTGVFGDGAADCDINVEVWRYYLLINRPQTADTSFLWDDFVQKNNNELLKNPGNLFNRVLKDLYIKFEKVFFFNNFLFYRSFLILINRKLRKMIKIS